MDDAVPPILVMSLQPLSGIVLPAVADPVVVASQLELVERLSSDPRPAVIVSDGLGAAEVPAVAEAVAIREAEVIEVRAEGWDGSTFSPLSAACRGVISGFGMAGVIAAVGLAAGASPARTQRTG